MNFLPKAMVGLIVASVGALACSSSSSGGGSGNSSSSGSSSGAAPTFTEVYSQVIQPNCATHHVTGGPDSFLTFETQANAYATLVGVKASGPACGSSGLTRVVAGNASESLLYEKVSQSSPPCGSQMPLNGTPLSSTDQTMIEEWINGGALND